MATDQELIDYYANLLIIQYLGKEKAYATIQTLVTPVIMNQLPTQVMNAFNVDGLTPAEGVQLDVIGKYVGVTRSGFGFDGQPIVLDDDDFRTLIRFATLQNSAGSSLYEIQNLIHTFFPDDILVFDYQNMQMSYLISTAIGSLNLLQLIVTKNLLPKPMAVGLAVVIFAPVITTFFGFRTYNLPAMNSSPFNTYDDYEMDRPWLSYADALMI